MLVVFNRSIPLSWPLAYMRKVEQVFDVIDHLARTEIQAEVHDEVAERVEQEKPVRRNILRQRRPQVPRE